ncbi:hypothetical protein [Phocoenobacter skyensis]|uniref:SIR2-like domain-containing protein n=1 Tax=Phocoenobacter skyensis TaxID=97481 RepID=A0AAJ6NF56_9PAST|nr:hypothetical protein [Pasteurella skyensis]MDP8175655.1 hypothetical protein [Pasteurella skyensis]
MTKKLIITGAGVDRSKGIDFPLANTLLGEIAIYLQTDEGKEIDQKLRKILPNLKFSFNNMIKNAVDKIVARDTHEQKEMVSRVQDAIKGLDKTDRVYKHGKLIINLFNKLSVIADENQLDNETEELIKEVFPKEANELIDCDTILDIQKLSLSDTFKTVMKMTLREGLTSKSNVVAEALSSDMLNIEILLIEKFLGFYNNKMADIKNYIYISWVLWVYLIHKQNEVFANKSSLPFYSKLPSNIKAITLNYTSFLQKQLGKENVICFHGGLFEYVRMDTRNLLPISNTNFDVLKFFNKTLASNTDVSNEDFNKQKYTIPSLVPPLRLKPVLSHKYIELWSKASQWIENAEHIIVIGYSFNTADEHFNDILRNLHSGKKIDIIVPEASCDYFKERIEKIFKVPANQFDQVDIQGEDAYQSGNIRLIPAKATDINIEELLNDYEQ